MKHAPSLANPPAGRRNKKGLPPLLPNNLPITPHKSFPALISSLSINTLSRRTSVNFSPSSSLVQPMDTKLSGLPPLKRFRLLQEQRQQESEAYSAHLPARKRKECRDLSNLSNSPVTSYCLPAKKRVWAIQPDFIPNKPYHPFDLNVEYNPSPLEEGRVDQEAIHVIPVAETDDGLPPATGEAAASAAERRQKGGQDKDEEDGIVCAVCESTDGDPLDPIVFCDGCDLMVHSTCYGNPLVKGIPEGDWFCAHCLQHKACPDDNSRSRASCCLCPVKDGALKPTSDGRWAHLLCSLLVPEVFFEDPEGREGIDCSMVPRRRWKEVCYLCKTGNGCAIECSEPKCPLAFHVTCGLKHGLCIEYKEGRGTGIVAGFCEEHTELWTKQQQTGKFKIVARDEDRK